MSKDGPGKRPVETSSKRPVSVVRQIVPVPKRVSHDPRFAPEQGRFDRKRFREDYDWLVGMQAEEQAARDKEIKALRAKGALTDGERERMQELKAAAQRYQTQQRKEIADEKFTKLRQESGKTRLKKGERRELKLVQKYRDLEDRGRLDQWMEKKRKRGMGDGVRSAPGPRRQHDGDA